MNNTHGIRACDLVDAICYPNLDTADARAQSIVRESLNLFTLGYLNCINLEDGTRKPGVSDEDYYYVMSNMPQVIEAVDRLVWNLFPIRLSRINEEAFATINSIYGHYTTKGFDKTEKFAVVLMDDLRERGMVLVKNGITPKSAMVAEFLKEISL